MGTDDNKTTKNHHKGRPDEDKPGEAKALWVRVAKYLVSSTALTAVGSILGTFALLWLWEIPRLKAKVDKLTADIQEYDGKLNQEIGASNEKIRSLNEKLAPLSKKIDDANALADKINASGKAEDVNKILSEVAKFETPAKLLETLSELRSQYEIRPYDSDVNGEDFKDGIPQPKNTFLADDKYHFLDGIEIKGYVPTAAWYTPIYDINNAADFYRLDTSIENNQVRVRAFHLPAKTASRLRIRIYVLYRKDQ